ncbi:MAG: hypothetical protein R2852_02325 [Bacteroidia bacterium]
MQNLYADKGDKYVFDIRNNSFVEYDYKYEEINNSKLNFNDEVSIHYPYLTSLEDSVVRKKINASIYQLVHVDIAGSPIWSAIKLDHDAKLKVYTENNPDFNDDFGYYRNNEIKYSVVMERVDGTIVSVYNNVLVFELSYEYFSQYESQKIDDNFSYKLHKYYDLNTGKEFSNNDLFLSTKLSELNTFIENKVKQHFELYSKSSLKPKDYDEYESEESFYSNLPVKRKPREQKLVQFNAVKDAHWEYLAFSISMQIDDWSPCMYNYYGKGLRLRFTFDELKPYVNPNGPFAGILTAPSYPLNIRTDMHRLDFLHSNFQFFEYNFPDQLNGMEKYNLKCSAGIKSMQVFHKERIRNDSFRQRKIKELKFNSNGYLESIEIYQYDKLKEKHIITYDELNRVSKTTGFEGGQIVQGNQYTYDVNGNLLSEKKLEDNGSFTEIFYLYLDSFCYIEQIHSDDEKWNLKLEKYAGDLKIEVINISSYNNAYRYKYGKANQILYSNTNGESPLRGSYYVYDTLENKRLISYSYDNGRYYKFFTYNANGQLVNSQYFGNNSLSQEKQIEYGEQNLMEKVIQIQGDSKYQNEFNFEYTFY